MGRDPELFDDPERFWPERFINSEFGTKPGADTTGFKDVPFSFGAGRVRQRVTLLEAPIDVMLFTADMSWNVACHQFDRELDMLSTPKRHIVLNLTQAINVMNMLWAFDFSLAKDPVTGLPIPVDADNTTDVRIPIWST